MYIKLEASLCGWLQIIPELSIELTTALINILINVNIKDDINLLSDNLQNNSEFYLIDFNIFLLNFDCIHKIIDLRADD